MTTFLFLIAKAICLAIYAMAVNRLIKKKKPKVLTSILLLHFIEYFLFGRRTGRRADKSNVYSAINTMLFGFTWWMPRNYETHQKETEAKAEKFRDRGTGIRFVPVHTDSKELKK